MRLEASALTRERSKSHKTAFSLPSIKTFSFGVVIRVSEFNYNAQLRVTHSFEVPMHDLVGVEMHQTKGYVMQLRRNLNGIFGRL